MITVTLQLDQSALDHINARFGGLSGVLRQPMAASLETLRSYMADNYPPKPSGSRYVRTGKLGQSWTVPQIIVTGNGLRGTVGAGISYARWVQSSESQAWMHRGRWRTDLDAVNANRARIVAHFQAAIQRALAGAS